MGQLEAFEKGLQGKNLITTDPENNYNGTTYTYSGKGLPERKGAKAINDIHVDDIVKPTGHVHTDPTLPLAGGADGLAARAQTLQGSKFNSQAKYEKPSDISENFS